jgi:hypothetical protein
MAGIAFQITVQPMPVSVPSLSSRFALVLFVLKRDKIVKIQFNALI